MSQKYYIKYTCYSCKYFHSYAPVKPSLGFCDIHYCDVYSEKQACYKCKLKLY